MISILIPTHRDDPSDLLDALTLQVSEAGTPVEIIVWDDGSGEAFPALLPKVGVTWRSSPHRQGRAATRMLLARAARYPFLLFLDADVLPKDASFLKTYQDQVESQTVLVGGIDYLREPPPPNRRFRWTYGRNREERALTVRQSKPYDHFMTGNFCIPRELFLRIADTALHPDYGHEDTLVGFRLAEDGILIRHIDNPVWHLGLEENAVFWDKSREAVASLVRLRREGHLLSTRLSDLGQCCRALGLGLVIPRLANLLDRPFMQAYIFRGFPGSLLFFDFLRLSWYLTFLRQTERTPAKG